ncbi:MAG: aminotransferase class I/II-fold pyridoxal phosphate-dependent enzyme [Pseudomonadaceae bacterium]|nr:aminotransferase class I/II-fold pyridoxal phosphate-dependent enzyme [Pseudomonadaceae bacterium]
MLFAERVNLIQPFRVMEVVRRAAEFEAQGTRVVHFEVGEPDFVTAQPIIEAGRQALLDGRTKYTEATGIVALREAISGHYAQLGIAIAPHRIIVTSGASGGLTLLAGLLLNPGDELLITDPGYPCNEVFAQLAGAVPKAIAVEAEKLFQPTLEAVESHWSAATRGVLFASPANPTGTMLPAQTLQQIAAFVAAENGFFILDEIYQGLTPEAAYRSGLALADDLFVLNSFSKFFGMTGWRLGWLVVPEAAVEGVTKLAQNLFIAPSTPAQYAALAAFSPAAMKVHRDRAEQFKRRATMLAHGLQQLGFKIPVQPQGAFYLYVDVSSTGLPAIEFCHRLLEEFQVAVTPGEDFGVNADQAFVRFAFTTDEASIALGLQKLQSALQRWGST